MVALNSLNTTTHFCWDPTRVKWLVMQRWFKDGVGMLPRGFLVAPCWAMKKETSIDLKCLMNHICLGGKWRQLMGILGAGDGRKVQGVLWRLAANLKLWHYTPMFVSILSPWKDMNAPDIDVNLEGKWQKKQNMPSPHSPHSCFAGNTWHGTRVECGKERKVVKIFYTLHYLYFYFIHSNTLQLGCIKVAHGAMKTLSGQFCFNHGY